MESIPSLISQTLPLPPSCIAFCPTQPDIFVVGTYFLHKGESAATTDGELLPWQKRTGSLILFRVETTGQDGRDGLRIRELFTLDTEWAVLDIQWSPHRPKGSEAIAVATSVPLIELYTLELSPDRVSAQLTSSTWLGPFEDTDAEEARDLLTLSLAWHPTRSELMALTLSDGQVQYCETDGDFAVMGHTYSSLAQNAHKHDLEAWTVAFSPASRGVFSGGDDCVLKYLRPGWDATNGVSGVEASWQDRRLHDAGVTAILPFNDHLVVTGSYDDHVRLIYAPTTGGRRQILADRDLGGGVWRLKMIEMMGALPDLEGECTSSLPFRCTILASCMHAGARVLRLCRGANGTWRFDVIAQFTEHESMNYGSDMQPLMITSDDAEATRMRRTIVSTSFYDKRLCLWKVDVDAAANPSAVEQS